MDELEVAIDLGPDNDQQLARLRRALILGSGFQLLFVEISHPHFANEVLRRLLEWSGIDGVPTLAVAKMRPGHDPIAALKDIAVGAVLVGIDHFFDVDLGFAAPDDARSEIEALRAPDGSPSNNPIERTMTTLNWYRDQLPSLVNGPLVLLLTPDGLRQLFVHAPDLLAWRSHTTRISTPRPIDLEIRPRPNRRASLEEKAWLERMIVASDSNRDGSLTRALPGWLIRLGEIYAHEGGGSWAQMFARAEELAVGRHDILFRLELARERRALDEGRYDDAELHEGKAAEQVSDSLGTHQKWESTRGTVGWGSGRRELAWVSHDAVFAELRIVRAERLLRIGEIEQAATVIESAMGSAHASGDLALVIAALGVAGSVATHRGDRLDATDRFSEMRDVARVARHRAAELFALTHLAELTSDGVAARPIFLQALSMMQEDDYEARARASIGLAMHDLLARNTGEAERVLSAIGPLSKLLPKTRIRVLIARGGAATARNDHDAALVAYRMARDEQWLVLPPSRQHAQVSVLLGEAALRAGNAESARDAYQRAAEIALVLADRQLLTAARRGLSSASIESRDTNDAGSGHGGLGNAGAESLMWTSTTYVPPAAAPSAKVTETTVASTPIDQGLAALESAFLALDAPGDAPERLDLLDRLARAYSRLGRRGDASLCYARAAWETPASLINARLDTWIASELCTAAENADDEGIKAALDRILADKAPQIHDVRLVAALAARAAGPIAIELHRVRRWLDDNDGQLDARSLWLSRVGLVTLIGGDVRSLAHTRDRILGRLASGSIPERELPTFLRLRGGSGALGGASVELLTKTLEALVQKIARTKRKRTLSEAPIQYTNAYVAFQLGYGFARIGQHKRARELVDAATRTLAAVAADPVHKYLTVAFGVRVEQAIMGEAPETSLPGALRAELAGLDRLARFKVDRLREASQILEPLVQLDAFGAYIQEHAGGPEFAAIRLVTEPAARAKEVDGLVQIASAHGGERERLVGVILNLLFELPEADAVPMLMRTSPLIAMVAEAHRATLYAKALVVAGHFGRVELVPELLKLLGVAIRQVTAPDLERVLQQSLRALRRIGLRNEIAQLLAEAEYVLPATGAAALRARLAIAAGLALLGEDARTLPIFDQARKSLSETKMMVSRLELTRSLALAYAQGPVANALNDIMNLTDQLGEITDALATNSHYCLSVLHFVESIVLGITSGDLALGESGRRFVEDDEHLIRRRMHRDLAGLRIDKSGG